MPVIHSCKAGACKTVHWVCVFYYFKWERLYYYTSTTTVSQFPQMKLKPVKGVHVTTAIISGDETLKAPLCVERPTDGVVNSCLVRGLILFHCFLSRDCLCSLYSGGVTVEHEPSRLQHVEGPEETSAGPAHDSQERLTLRVPLR